MTPLSDPDQGIPAGRDSDLLPTPSLSPDEFEDFTERLLSAHRHVVPPARHVVRVERWGRRGDKQDGIDFEGTWSDGQSAAWQCKRLDALTVPDVQKFIKACTFTADEFFIVYSGEASHDARDEVKKHPGWELLDRRGLGRMLGDLPLHLQRSVLDATWGPVTRRQYLETPGEDSFLGVQTVLDRRLDSGALLNDLGAKAGRVPETAAIDQALDRTTDWPLVVLVSGRGGAGKTRLLAERMAKFQHENPRIPVLWLAPGRSIDGDALKELPYAPAVIVVDDAHRLTEQLRPLIEYANQQPGTQLILGSRGPGISTIRAQLVEAGLRDRQVEAIPIGELTSSEARALVDSVLQDMNATFELRDFLAGQARRSPFLAVLTANLLRAGELTGPLNLDAGLREQVMVRYRDVVTDGIASESQPAVRKMLASIAALGTVDLSDTQFRTQLSALSGIPPVELLRVIEKLRGHDVLIGPPNATQFAVEMLGDQLLEAEAIIGGVDSGFTLELWNAFKASHRTAVLSGLGSLAWRLGENGRSLIATVWSEMEAEVAASDLDGLHWLIGSLRGVAYAQPAEIVHLSARLVDRLNELDNAPQDPPDANTEETESFWLRPATRRDVERALAPVIADTAVYNADVLEQVLDILWRIAQHDQRAPAQHSDHPFKLIEDRLANLGDLPDLSYPERIADAVHRWVADYDHRQGTLSPLPPLASLLTKEGTTTEWSDRRTLRFKPFFVSPDWARPVRDQIRSTLVDAATDDSPFAFEAIRMLGAALRPPMGMFGATVPLTTERGWDEDDLATLDAFAVIVTRTSRPAIRRLIRRQIEWEGMYSRSAMVRRAALVLITELDERPEDDLSDYLSHPGVDVGLPSRRGISVPSIGELETLIESGAENADDFDAKYAAAQTAMIEALTAVIEDLWPGEDVIDGVRRLDAEARDVSANGTAVWEQLHTVFAQLLSDRPTFAGELFQAIPDLPPGPLDDTLPQLLEGLRVADEPALKALIHSYLDANSRVRAALGRAASRYNWLSRGPSYTELTRQGREDEDPTVRNTFMTTVRLDLDPVEGARLLIDGEADEATIRAVIRATAHHAAAGWSVRLRDEEVKGVLSVVGRVHGSSTASGILAELATAHPYATLQHLAEKAVSGTARQERDQRVAHALQGQAAEVARWIVDISVDANARRVVRRVRPPLPAAPGAELAAELSSIVTPADATTVVNVAATLTGFNGWAPFAPGLARLLLEHPDLNPAECEKVLGSLKVQLTPGLVSGIGGQSPELNAALEAAREAEAAEPNATLKQLFAQSVRALEHRIEEFATPDDDEDGFP
ncbi:restriction endonuclease [Agromyces laixinhei]|uniref:P-loop NTPase n=1 Tax=Agromyces laixinhei TaxID=2585717 RepID=UPI001E33F2BC|nr:restriction endonuclease [Agromyces laixinhei]